METAIDIRIPREYWRTIEKYNDLIIIKVHPVTEIPPLKRQEHPTKGKTIDIYT